ncbi:MAG: GTP 3',8-cyclase MoaA [Archangiaceae bacterium]|nr:GTP 3',8-cyclase MoaA [Archangiaceae bacterium]
MTQVTADALARPLRNLRISVTDRCNLRCAYCMPEEDYVWLPGAQILSFEELSALVDRFIALGVKKVRLTGGEPLLRRELPELVKLLASKPLEDLALTTNGVLLEAQAQALADAGLHRVTVSLDTLTPARFVALTRRDALSKVLAGIDAAARVFPKGLKLDAVMIKGLNDDELVPLLDFGSRVGAEVRFIEYMDVGGATLWSRAQVLSRAEMLQRLGPVTAIADDGWAPAERFRLADGRVFGIIASTTAPFCRTCDRARLTADGMLLTCLYGRSGTDLKTPLRAGASAGELEALVRGVWSARRDRGAEERLALSAARAPLRAPQELHDDPHLEMHTRGG